jgi:hypothetical protein
LQKQVAELKAQVTKQTQLAEKAKSETAKVREEADKAKGVLETKLGKEKAKNKTEKITGMRLGGWGVMIGMKRKAVEEAPPLLSPMKTAPTRKLEPKKPAGKKPPLVSDFSTTPFLVRQGSVMPQASPSIAANTSILSRPAPSFGGKSKRPTVVRANPVAESVLDEDSSLDRANTSLQSETSVLKPDPKKKKRKLGGGVRTLLPLPDESPVRGDDFGVASLMFDSPVGRPKFAGGHLLGSVKKKRGPMTFGMRGSVLKTTVEEGENKLRDIKKAFTLNV